MSRDRIVIPFLMGLAGLVAMTASSVAARDGARPVGATQIVFVHGKAAHCEGPKGNRDCFPPRDVVKSISPAGGAERELAEVRSVAELSATEDGKWVAILSRIVAGGGANSAAYAQIFLLPPGGKLREVLDERLEFNANGLAISPDGRLLAFSGKRRGSEYPVESKVWVVRANETGMRQLTKGPGDDSTPAFSPDGKRIVFQRGPIRGSGEKDSELYSVGIGGGVGTRLTEDEVDDVNPVFSPDGETIAFGQYKRGKGKIATMPAEGGAARTVTSTGSSFPDPDYSPNGGNLVFTARAGGGSPLTTVRATGGGRKIVTEKFDFPGLPQWTARP